MRTGLTICQDCRKSAVVRESGHGRQSCERWTVAGELDPWARLLLETASSVHLGWFTSRQCFNSVSNTSDTSDTNVFLVSASTGPNHSDLYPKRMIRALGRLRGSNSVSVSQLTQSPFLFCIVHVRSGWAPMPCTATMLRVWVFFFTFDREKLTQWRDLLHLVRFWDRDHRHRLLCPKTVSLPGDARC